MKVVSDVDSRGLNFLYLWHRLPILYNPLQHTINGVVVWVPRLHSIRLFHSLYESCTIDFYQAHSMYSAHLGPATSPGPALRIFYPANRKDKTDFVDLYTLWSR